jgi:hypothetical protein
LGLEVLTLLLTAGHDGWVITLAEQLHPLLPHLTARGQQVLAAVANQAGRIGGANCLTRQLGLPSRHCLARLLRREGLPAIEELCGWMSVLNLLQDYEHTHQSLYQLAIRTTRHPPTCYRTVKRITGKTWTQVRMEGFHFALISFLKRCADLREGTSQRLALLAG